MIRTTIPADLFIMRATHSLAVEDPGVLAVEVGRGDGCFFGWGEPMDTDQCAPYSYALLTLTDDGSGLLVRKKIKDFCRALISDGHQTVVEYENERGDWTTSESNPIYYTDTHIH